MQTEIQEIVDFPLSDGTVARITVSAAERLEQDFGITKGRVRRGERVDSVVVRPIRAFSESVPKPAKEVPLRDLLGTFVYKTPELRNPEAGQSFYLLDSNARNLMPENIRLTERPEIQWPEPKPRVKKITPFEVPLSAQQLANELGELFEELKSDARKKILSSKAQADEVLAKVMFELLRQIRNGTCPAKNKNELFVWASCSLTYAASWKRNAIRAGVCRDVDHDDAEIRLLRVVRKSAELREAAGLSVESPDWMLPDCVSTPELARMFEADAAEVAAAKASENKRIDDEGGAWKSPENEYATAGFMPGHRDKPPKDSDLLLNE